MQKLPIKCGWALSCLVFASVALAQLPPADPAPGEGRVVGPQLIAWSALQKPQPIPQQPQPLPTPDEAKPSSPTQGQTQPAQRDQTPPKDAQQPEPETQQTRSQSVMGTITKIGGNYILQTSDNLNYQLDTKVDAAQYVGKHVKVTGTLDRATNIIHVRSIELLS